MKIIGFSDEVPVFPPALKRHISAWLLLWKARGTHFSCSHCRRPSCSCYCTLAQVPSEKLMDKIISAKPQAPPWSLQWSDTPIWLLDMYLISLDSCCKKYFPCGLWHILHIISDTSSWTIIWMLFKMVIISQGHRCTLQSPEKLWLNCCQVDAALWFGDG